MMNLTLAEQIALQSQAKPCDGNAAQALGGLGSSQTQESTVRNAMWNDIQQLKQDVNTLRDAILEIRHFLEGDE